MRIWDTATRRQLCALRGQTHWVSGLALETPTAGACWVSAGERDKAVVKAWDVGTGQEVLSRTLPARRIDGLAFSPEGRGLATTVWRWDEGGASRDNTRWSSGTFERCLGLTLTGHTTDIDRLAPRRRASGLREWGWDRPGSGNRQRPRGCHAARPRFESRPVLSCLRPRLPEAGHCQWHPQPSRPAGDNPHLGPGHRPGDACPQQQSGESRQSLLQPHGHCLASADYRGVIKVWDAPLLPDDRSGGVRGRDEGRDRSRSADLALMVVLQPQEIDVAVFGPPGLGVRRLGHLVPPYVVFDEGRRPRLLRHPNGILRASVLMWRK